MSSDELVGTDDLLGRVHPDDVDQVIGARERLRRAEAVHVRCRIRHADGRWQWVDLRSRVVDRSDDGCDPLVVANWRIVNDEVAHLEALAASEARNRELAQQLQQALETRVVIEQAKGVVAERDGISIGQAFENIRHYARRHSRGIHDVAGDIIDRNLRL